MTNQLMKPVRYNPEARFEAVLVTMDNAEEVAKEFRGEIKYLSEPEWKLVLIPTLGGTEDFKVAPWTTPNELLIVDNQTGRVDKISQRDFDAKYMWVEMSELEKAPDGWVGFHPDDPARLETFAEWLDMLDAWCATQDSGYVASDEIQLDARRIARTIRSHLPETAHPVEYMTTYDEIRSWSIGNGWPCAGFVWTSPDGRQRP